jgi:hypothetical protein
MKRDARREGGSAAARARRNAARRRYGAAYTAVEVLMSLAVLAVGVVGIIATEKVTLASNVHAKNLAIATRIAEGWLGMLEAESALWDKSGSLTDTTWLLQGFGLAGWFRPTYSGTLEFGPAFDALGNPVRTQDQNPNARFCVDVRLSQLTPSIIGGGLMRTEVRVIWLRNDGAIAGATATHACSVAAATVDTAASSPLFHFVYMSSAVRQVGK